MNKWAETEPNEHKNTWEKLSFINHALNQSTIIAITDSRGKITYANDHFCEISKYERQELIGQNHRILQSGYHDHNFFKQMWATIGKGEIWRGEIKNKAKDGTFYWVDTTIVPFLNDRGKPYQYVAIRHNITPRKEMEQLLRSSEEKYRLITENSFDLICMISTEGMLKYVSPSFTKRLGWKRQELENHSIFQIVKHENRSKVSDVLKKMYEEQIPVQLEFQLISKQGEAMDVEATINPIASQTDTLRQMAVVMRDITERKKAEQTIYHLAYHDTLTDLPNRRLFIDTLRKAVQEAKRNQTMAAVIFLDLDHFKMVNDSAGHEVGDLILMEAAKRMRECVRSHDLVARLGGDEFTVILTKINHVQEVETISKHMQELLREPIVVGGRTHHISCSMGIACYPEDGASADQLLKRADMALYTVKDQGRNGHAFFAPKMEQLSLERVLMENELRKAIQNQQFQLEYQPKIDFSTGELIGTEALVRWQHPELGRIQPNNFIPLAEETGLILPLGDWIIQEACAQNKAWQDAGFPPLKMSVNLSARQFHQQDLPGKIDEILQQTGLQGKWLELEVTESVFADAKKAVSILKEIRQLGVHTSIDDFGTGYSSFSFIKQFPIDTLKIDASFIQDLHKNKESRAIVRAILKMAQSLNVDVIAEGIESKEQLAFLHKEGCVQGQGYLFSKPLTRHAFEAYLQNVNHQPRKR